MIVFPPDWELDAVSYGAFEIATLSVAKEHFEELAPGGLVDLRRVLVGAARRQHVDRTDGGDQGEGDDEPTPHARGISWRGSSWPYRRKRGRPAGLEAWGSFETLRRGPRGVKQRHAGREWGYVISGELHVTIAFNDHVLQPGDSIAFDSTVPHRLHNPGENEVHAVWFVLGRHSGHPGGVVDVID